VHPASLRPQLLGHGVDEGGEIVVGRSLDLGDPLDRRGDGTCANRGDIRGGDDAQVSPRIETLVIRDFPRARIWLTEYGYQTNPPDRFLGVSRALQARYLSEGAYAAYRAPRVDLLIHFLYRDEPELSRFQSGLVTLGNAPKPALSAFRLPLAETGRRGTTTSLWGQLRSPESGASGVLERRVASGWQSLATVRLASEDRFFRWRGTLPRGSVVRIRSGTLTGAPLTIT
jgi:hypothetical protein